MRTTRNSPEFFAKLVSTSTEAGKNKVETWKKVEHQKERNYFPTYTKEVNSEKYQTFLILKC